MFVCCVLFSITLGLKGHNLVPLKPTLVLYLASDQFKALTTHPTNVILLDSISLILAMVASCSFLNTIFKGWK
jgi:hypothetical protein